MDTLTNSSYRFGFWVSAITAIVTAATFVVAVLTPPKAGPFCLANCVAFPYTDVAAYVPGDFLWMYSALFVAPLFVVLLAAMHERTLPDRQRFSRIAVAFGVMSATILTADYVVQLRYVQTAVLTGEVDGLAAWSQYNPHGVFIALEEAGYTLLGPAFMFAGLSFSAERRLLRASRIVFLAGTTCLTVAFVIISSVYGFNVEYRFEVAAITVDWSVVIIASTLHAVDCRSMTAKVPR